MLVPANEKNAFLSGISAAEYAALRGHLAPMELRVGQYLHYFEHTVDAVIFPDSGVIAMSMPLRDHPGAAAALVGRDGIVGALAAISGAPAGSDAVVHIAGHAAGLPADVFRQLLDQNPSLLRRLARYAQALIAQSQQNAICHALHPVESRICRWLPAIQARYSGERVPLTQGALAQMLGVRRTTVTLMAGQLVALGIISCRRGHIQIIDQNKLEQHSCECHSMLSDYMSRLASASAAVRDTAKSGALSGSVEAGGKRP